MTIIPIMLKRYLFLTACLFIKCLIVSSTVLASNEISRVNAMEDQGRIGIMVFFKDRPSYSLDAVNEAQIQLNFHNTLKGPTFQKNIPEKDMFSLNEGRNPVSLMFTVKLQRPFSRIDSSWSEDKKMLYIEISSTDGQTAGVKSPQGKITLRDIRFGFIDKGTRMVMKLDGNPSWGIEFSNPSALRMHLADVSGAMEKGKFGPVKRLKVVDILKAKDNGTDISIGLESPLIHVGIFRVSEGDRLVLDILDAPGAVPADALTLNNNTSDTGTALTEDEGQTRKVIEDKGNYLRIKIDKSEVPAVASSTESKPVSAPAAKPENSSSAEPDAKAETIPGGRANIQTGSTPAEEAKTQAGNPAEGETKAAAGDIPADVTGMNNLPAGEVKTEAGKPAAAGIDAPVKIEPRLDDTLPMSAEMKQEMDKLSPEEAFLYGRIKQTLEIKDYEKGIVLANQFLSELPGSTLVEEIMFLKGDLYYSLWKNGDNEVLRNIISSYQKAIDRFSDSVYVPSSYIKMAQAQSSKGEEYLALGYLGLVMAQKKNSALLPLAYLTRGKIFLRLDQNEKAVADFNVVMEQYKDSEYAAEADFWTANSLHAAGRYEDAEKKLEEVLDMDPAIFIDHPEYLFLRAKNYLHMKDYDQAREYLFKAVNIGRQQEGADMLLTRIGDTYHSQDNEKEAEKYYRMVIDYYPGTEGTSISRLRMASYSSDTSIFDELSSTGKENESISELALLQKGYQLYDKNQYADAADAVKQLVDKPVETETRKSARSLFFNAAEKEIERLYGAGNFKGAADFYSSRKDLLAGNIRAESMLNAATAFKKINMHEQAIPAFQGIKSNELGLQSRGAYYTGFAESYLNNGDIAEARALLEKAKNYDLQPMDRQRVFRSLALLYIEDNMLNDAYRLCRSIIDGEKVLPDEELAEVYLLTGRILNMQKRYADAEGVIISTPGMPDRVKNDLLKPAYMELGKSYYNMGDYQRAARSYEKGFNLGYGAENRDYWNLRFSLAQSYMNAGEDNKARTLLSEISEGGDGILQQRAQLQLGTMDLEKQLQRLPMGGN